MEDKTYYCKHCLSLKILRLKGDRSICCDCGSCNVADTTWDKYEKIAESKGKKLIKKNKYAAEYGEKY